MQLNDTSRARLEAHQRRLERPLRVLFIGNIANNAFYGARLLRRVGIACDVVAYDYYHVMGCPEWEEADFDNRIGDQFRPDWSALDLRGYTRPAWFIQGPLELCLHLLIARHEKRADDDARICRQVAILNRTERSDWRDAMKVRWRIAMLFAHRLINLWRFPVRLANRLKITARDLRRSRRMSHRLAGLLLSAVSPAIVRLSRYTSTWFVDRTILPGTPEDARDYCARLCADFARAFPERADNLQLSDLEPYLVLLPLWKQVMSHYDIVQGFATDPIWPLLARKPYFALEHGTLRDLPFEPTAQGRITTMGYHRAEHVFVTNSDCLDNAHRLAGDRVTSINHPYDEDANFPVNGWQKERKEFQRILDADFLVFHPTRQDWVVGTGYADKANDVFFRALAELRLRGLRVGAVCCAWGRNVRESEKLLEELTISQYVRWLQPLAHVRFLRVAQACGLIADQFKLGGFGGITFKALAAGIPVCTNLDVAASVRSFGEAPPILRTSDVGALVREIEILYHDRGRLATLAAESRAWIKRNHSGAQVLNAFVERYCDHLDDPPTRIPA